MTSENARLIAGRTNEQVRERLERKRTCDDAFADPTIVARDCKNLFYVRYGFSMGPCGEFWELGRRKTY